MKNALPRTARIVMTVLCAGIFSLPAAAAAQPPSPQAARADLSGPIQAAQHQFHAGNYADAILTLQAAVSRDASNTEAYYWLGRSYYELRDYDSAISQLGRAVALEARNSVYHQWLGRAYGGKADREGSFFLARKVKKEFQQAVSLNPSNLAARRDLAEFCLDAPWIVGGSKDEALQQVNAIAALDPVEGHLVRAVYYQEGLKRLDQAEKEYQQVLAAKPKRIEPYLEAADFYRGQGKAAEVSTAIQAAEQVGPGDARLPFYRGVTGVLTYTDLANAEQDLKSYLASTPERSDWPSHAAAREWLGRLYETQGKRTEAAEQYRAALQLDPKRREAQAGLVRLSQKTSR